MPNCGAPPANMDDWNFVIFPSILVLSQRRLSSKFNSVRRLPKYSLQFLSSASASSFGLPTLPLPSQRDQFLEIECSDQSEPQGARPCFERRCSHPLVRS